MKLLNINPSIKALTIILCVLVLARFFDPVTPLLALVGTITVTFVFGRVDARKWLLMFSPFLFIAFIYVWSAVLFPKVDSGDTVIWEWSFLVATEEGLARGISLGLRVLSFTALSLLFALTTSPSTFLLSLMQQCKLPPKLAYGILAGYRFLPIIKDEYQQLRTAHRIRGVGRAKSVPEKIKQLKRYVIPLLAGAIRKAERTALAMESKGFTGDRNRTIYKEIKVTFKDWVFLVLMISIIFFSAFVSWKTGYLQMYNGEL